ncbi:MAG TPA: type II toxin-antitoxin system RelE/ParE family toxin [Acidobacteriaceae bacterium]|nr:type II toxin-antitoxin system RelE/ParE family toxin [Acidobacteriaceae bacterium]
MAWTIVFSDLAKKNLAKMDAQTARRITAFLRERVASLDNPRSIGQALQGSTLGNLWRYRVGDYRIVCDLQDGKVIVLVLRIGHRREVYP